jgi:hypothetical protein
MSGTSQTLLDDTCREFDPFEHEIYLNARFHPR